jgi:hypothetical protein
MYDKNTRRTLLPRVKIDVAAASSAFLALAAIALVALGIGLIYLPAGVIAAGLGCAVLQWQLFGGTDPGAR